MMPLMNVSGKKACLKQVCSLIEVLTSAQPEHLPPVTSLLMWLPMGKSNYFLDRIYSRCPFQDKRQDLGIPAELISLRAELNKQVPPDAGALTCPCLAAPTSRIYFSDIYAVQQQIYRHDINAAGRKALPLTSFLLLALSKSHFLPHTIIFCRLLDLS